MHFLVELPVKLDVIIHNENSRLMCFMWLLSNSLGTSRWQSLDGRYYSSEGSSATDERQHKATQKSKAKQKREEAKLKLNSLLESIGKVTAIIIQQTSP